jgi:Tetratricopeptide repeat
LVVGQGGRNSAAVAGVGRALAINEKVLGPEHPWTAINVHNLGRLLSVQGDFAGAQLLQERALALNEKAFGHEHPRTVWSLSNLGHLLHNQGDLAGARTLCEASAAEYHPWTDLTRSRICGESAA